MRGRISYVMIVISPTFIKILVDHAISQTRPYFFLTVRPFLSLLPHYVFLWFMDEQWQQQEKVRPGNEATMRYNVTATLSISDNLSMWCCDDLFSGYLVYFLYLPLYWRRRWPRPHTYLHQGSKCQCGCPGVCLMGSGGQLSQWREIYAWPALHQI